MTYMATPYHKIHRGHEIYNFGRPFLGHHYFILSLSDLCLGVERKFYITIYLVYLILVLEERIHKFYTFYSNITSWGLVTISYLSPHSTDTTHSNHFRLV